MRASFVVGCGLVLAGLAFRPAGATVNVAIDLTHQRMHVVGAQRSYDWPISSARSGFTTPGGSYAPTHLELMHYSRKYHMSPMPHAIFFRGGYAIHGTYSIGELGRPASHGCVRLSPGHAAMLYGMVQQEGARISIAGAPPSSRLFARGRTPRIALARRLVGPPVVSARRFDRGPLPMPVHPRLVRTVSDAPFGSRRPRRPAHHIFSAPVYGYGVVYGRAPAYSYAPGTIYAPAPYAAVPYAPAYVSASPIGGPVPGPPLIPYDGE